MMNPDYDRQTAEAVDRLLKELPELTAPQSLSLRVTSAIRNRAASPRRINSWETWPRPLRAGLFMSLLMLFAGICLASTTVTHAPAYLAVSHTLGIWAGDAGSALHFFASLLVAFVLALRNLGTKFIVAVVVAVGFAYVLCVGLGTFCVKYAFARR